MVIVREKKTSPVCTEDSAASHGANAELQKEQRLANRQSRTYADVLAGRESKAPSADSILFPCLASPTKEQIAVRSCPGERDFVTARVASLRKQFGSVRLIVGGERAPSAVTSVDDAGNYRLVALHPNDFAMNIDPCTKPDLVADIASYRPMRSFERESFREVEFQRIPRDVFIPRPDSFRKKTDATRTGHAYRGRSAAIDNAARVLEVGGRLTIMTGRLDKKRRTCLLDSLKSAGMQVQYFEYNSEGFALEAVKVSHRFR